MLKNFKGITLIALVVTIVIMLILSGIAIATLTGKNGILNKATTTKQRTEQATAEERVKIEVAGSLGEDGKIDKDILNENLRKNIEGLTYNEKIITEAGVTDENRIGSLPAIVKLDGYEIIINENGSASTIIRMAEYQTEDTKPYLPGSNFSQVEGTDLTTGLVVTDGTNYWTWIEVPKTKVFTTATSETDYTNIENNLQTYTTTASIQGEDPLNLSRNGYTDQWYDYYGASYDGNSEYSQVKFLTSSKFDEAKEYYGAIYTDNTLTTEATSFGNSSTIYYVEINNKLEDDRGCGLTYNEYNNLKKYMLNSVYRNGGFWIGQYEGGTIGDYPGNVIAENDTRTIVIKQGAYPYNFITCANAQKKVSKLNSGDYKSSLMFGIQWDLVIKHLQVKGKMTEDDLTVSSKDNGNYKDSTFTIENGQYTISASTSNSFKIYTESTSGYLEDSTKLQDKSVLLTTGATKRNMRMNIYDLAGNVWEWTLEKSTYLNNPCAVRGGSYDYYGTYTVSNRRDNSSPDRYSSYGFRSALY